MIVINNKKCQANFVTKLTDKILCLMSPKGNSPQAGACSGDSGGPFTVKKGEKHELVGVSSFVNGLGCTDNQSTANGYTAVTKYVTWMKNKMR
jgi:secreted trypsin-like serine protease